jgi:RHS repeat-associated protein
VGLRYALQDIQGSTRAVLSASGTVAARHDYLPFGEEIGGGIGARSALSEYGWTDGNRWDYGLTGRDQKSRLDHTLFRKYEGFSGRWTSPDPYRGSMTIANPQSFNRYSYTQNDPVNFVDPTGLAWCFDDQTHKWVECDNVIVDRWEPRSLFNSYFLDAWKSGHSIEIIRLLGGMDPSSTVVPEKPIPGETLRSIQARTNACLNAALGRYLGKEAKTLAKLAAANAAMGLAVGGALVFGAEGLAAAEGATIVDIGMDGLLKVDAVGRAAVFGASAVYVAGKYWTGLVKEAFANKRDYLRDIERCHSDGPG